MLEGAKSKLDFTDCEYRHAGNISLVYLQNRTNLQYERDEVLREYFEHIENDSEFCHDNKKRYCNYANCVGIIYGFMREVITTNNYRLTVTKDEMLDLWYKSEQWLRVPRKQSFIPDESKTWFRTKFETKN